MANQHQPRGRRAETWRPRSAAGRRPEWALPDGAVRWAGQAAQHLRAWALADVGPGRLIPWLAIAFGTGIVLYFTAEQEPALWAALALTLAMIAAAIAVRHRPVAFPVVLGFAAVAAGFATATVKQAIIAHPVLQGAAWNVELAGFVETREERERSDRIVVRVNRIAGPRLNEKLERVRLAVRKGTAPPVGSFVEMKARLTPPVAPLRPGGYDYARDLYFQGIGASGFALGRIRTADAPADGGWWLRYAAAIDGMRETIDKRIRAVVPGDRGAIASALITGKRDAITTPVNDAMYVSSLAHVLSISGYHMVVVSGVVFFTLRALLALIPGFAARHPIKKWAALAALGAATFYLLLSGAEVATQRSYIMVAIVLLGVMVDRPALTLRTLTAAALGVLLLAPEAVAHPSFQMSFAATLALVAGYERGLPWLMAGAGTPLGARMALWGGREIVALLIGSMVAGFATTIFAAYHFHRLAPYGVIANLLVMPVVSAWIMPMGILGVLALPFGFDAHLLAADGRRHRLDDRGGAVGHEPAGRGWPHVGVRDWPGADRQPRSRGVVPAEDAAAARRRGAGGARRGAGAAGAAARRAGGARWRKLCRARGGGPPGDGQERQRSVRLPRLARGRCGSPLTQGQDAGRGHCLRRGRLHRPPCRWRAGRDLAPDRGVRRGLPPRRCRPYGTECAAWVLRGRGGPQGVAGQRRDRAAPGRARVRDHGVAAGGLCAAMDATRAGGCRRSCDARYTAAPSVARCDTEVWRILIRAIERTDNRFLPMRRALRPSPACGQGNRIWKKLAASRLLRREGFEHVWRPFSIRFWSVPDPIPRLLVDARVLDDAKPRIGLQNFHMRLPCASGGRGSARRVCRVSLREVCGRRSIPPEQAHHLALDAHAVGRQDPHLVGGVGRLERDRGAAAAEALERRLLVVDQGDHDVAGVGGLGAACRSAMSPSRMPASIIESPRTSSAKCSPLDEHVRRHVDDVALGLDRLDRRAGGDAAHDRHRDRAAAVFVGAGAHAAEIALDDARGEAARARRRPHAPPIPAA